MNPSKQHSYMFHHEYLKKPSLIRCTARLLRDLLQKRGSKSAPDSLFCANRCMTSKGGDRMEKPTPLCCFENEQFCSVMSHPLGQEVNPKGSQIAREKIFSRLPWPVGGFQNKTKFSRNQKNQKGKP
jgi:hypothetical protein